ncbi:MAG: MarC family protein [Flavobacteriales bacterium]
MSLDFNNILSCFLVLFVAIDAPGIIPVAIKLRDKTGNIQALKASLIAGVIMILFLFIGEKLLDVMGIDIYSFAIAGSFILFFLALEMVLGIEIYKFSEYKTVAVVPLAFPMIAGTGSLTSILSLHSKYGTDEIAVAIVLNVLIMYITLESSKQLGRLLGKAGIDTLQKIFGVILLAIAVEIFTNSLKLME